MRAIALCLITIIAAPAVAQDHVNLCQHMQGGMPGALNSAPNFAFTAGKAIDGNPATGWVSQEGGFPVWLRVQWRYPVEVHQVVFRGFENCPLTTAGPVGEYAIEALDGDEWVQIATGDASASAPSDDIAHQLDAPLTTHGIRLLVTSAPTGQAAVSELRVIGPDPVLPVEWTRKWEGRWIWAEPSLVIPHREPNTIYFRRSFEIADPTQIAECWLIACAFDRLNNTWLNENPAIHYGALHGGSLREPQVMQIPVDWLLAGENVLAAEVDDLYECGSHGLLAELVIVNKDGSRTTIITDDQWTAHTDQGDTTKWRKPGLTDTRWLPATVGTGANTRWHWSWNVPRPSVAPTDQMTLVGMDVQPAVIKPGTDATVTLTFDCAEQISQDYAVVARLGQRSFWRDHDFELWGAYLTPDEARTSEWAPGRREVTLTVPVPDYAPSATDMTLSVSTPEAAAGLATAVEGVTADAYGLHLTLAVDRGNPPAPAGGDFPLCEVRDLSGTPALHIDGQPTAPVIWSSSYSGYQRFSEYASTGARIFRILLEGSPICAPGEEEDYYPWWLEQVDRAVGAAVSMDPRSRVIVATRMDPNPQWLFDDPSQQMLGGRGSLVIPLSLLVPDRGQVRPTFMSQAWRRDGGEGLRRLVEHMRAQPYAPNMIGVCFFAGRAGENYWGGNERNAFLDRDGRYDCVTPDKWETGDFSTAARQTFRDFLMRKYGTDQNLQQAWRRDDITFDDIIEPARFDREEITSVLTWADKPEGAGSLRDALKPGEGTLPVDYYQCFAEAMIDTFAAWGQAVKDASDGRLITGCFYGYAVSQLYTAVPGFHGHTAVARANAKDELDFFVSPSEYNNARRPGGPYWGLNITDSLRLHDKLWIYEQDTRTYLAEHMPKTFSRDNTIAVMRRDAACGLTHGAGWWWYEFANGQTGRLATEWFIDPEIQAFASHIKRVYDHALTLPDRGPSSQIAVFYHGETLTGQDIFAPTAQINIPIGRSTLVNGVQRIGAPYDFYNLADIPVLAERGLLDQYRMCLMLNPFYLTPEERGWLKILKSNDRTLVWLWAPGMGGSDRSPSADSVAQTVGIPGIKALDRGSTLAYRIAAADHPLLAGIAAGQELSVMPFGPGATWAKFGNDVRPLVHVDPQTAPDDVVMLGNWVVDGEERADLGAFCVRELDGWRSVYAAVPYLTPELMRNIARWSGVHIYREGTEVTYADRHFAAIHTGAEPATGELRLPVASPRLYYLGDSAAFQAAVEN